MNKRTLSVAILELTHGVAFTRGFLVVGLILFLSVLLVGCSQDNAIYQPAVAKLIEKASVLKNSGRMNEAICRLEAAADIAPETYQVQYNLGVLYSETEQWEPAISHLEKALAISPDQPDALYILGYSYETLGNSYFDMANSKEKKSDKSEDSNANLPKDEALSRGKETYSKAISAYERFLNVAPPNDPSRKNVEEQVNHLKSRLEEAV